MLRHFNHSLKERNAAKKEAAETSSIASLSFVSLAAKGDFDDATITKYADKFPEWIYPANYSTGDIARYGDKLYRCLQAHTSQESWKPDTAGSLWKEIGDPTAEYPEWVQPTGSIDAYHLGAKVSHNGQRWISAVESNVWEPGVSGWYAVEDRY